MAANPLHADKSPTRLLDKPFGFSEFNYAAPNAYRTESGPLTGAYAALQGWDAIWRFAFSHDMRNLTQPSPGNYFDVSVDPGLQGRNRGSKFLQFMNAGDALGRRLHRLFALTPVGRTHLAVRLVELQGVDQAQGLVHAAAQG